MKKRINYGNVIFWIMLYLGFTFMGFAIGMAYQQVLFVKGITYIMEYSDIEVDINFNETKFVEELNNTLISVFKEALELNDVFNQTENITTKCKKIPC